MGKAKTAVDPVELEEKTTAPEEVTCTECDCKGECLCPHELTEDEIIAANEARMKELVEIELFYDGDKYKDDVTVGVNGKTWLIKRGERVTVPRFVAEVIKNSMEQDKASAIGRRLLESDFERNAKKYNASEE